MRDLIKIINKKRNSSDKYELASLFHNNTELNTVNIKEHAKQIEEYYNEGDYKPLNYPYSEKIDLPKLSSGYKNIQRVVTNRRTKRDFSSSKKLSLKKISNILKLSYGNRGVEEKTLSTVPSAGAIYPLHIYLISLNTELKDGIYHYYFENNFLDSISEKNLNEKELEELIITRGIKGKIPLYMVITADLRNLCSKYGDRGYRFALLEAGHLGQNILLTAESLNIGAVPFGGFYDKNLAKFLSLNYEYNKAMYIIGIG